MAYAAAADVAARLGRPLTTDEQSQVETFLSDVEIDIKAKISDLDDKVEDEDYLAVVKRVEASAVARLLRNPNGYTSETDGDYTYQLNWRMASGELQITDKEWALLGISSGVFLINPRVPTPYEDSYWQGVPQPWNDPTSEIFQYNDMFWGQM